MTSQLFSPFSMRGITVDNRTVVSPMCEYSAVDGDAQDWHLMHLGQYAVSGIGLIITEAAADEPRGRITPRCLGLWSDSNEVALDRVVRFCREHGSARMGVQLAHAGRKASTHRPWEGRDPLSADEGAWETVSSSANPHAEGWHTPKSMDRTDLDTVKAAFVDSARRAQRIGFDVIELDRQSTGVGSESATFQRDRATTVDRALCGRHRAEFEWLDELQCADTLVSGIIDILYLQAGRTGKVGSHLQLEFGQIGADRLADAVAAFTRFGAPSIVIDFGTAVTFDVVGAPGRYLGGVIAPGMMSMTENLAKRTALVPRIDLAEPDSAIGRSTVEAMQIGAVIGYRGMIREILQAIDHELEAPPYVVATGGDAPLIARGLPEIKSVVPDLTLEGIRLIGEDNR